MCAVCLAEAKLQFAQVRLERVEPPWVERIFNITSNRLVTLTNIARGAGSPPDAPSAPEIRTVAALLQCQSQIVHKSLHFYS